MTWSARGAGRAGWATVPLLMVLAGCSAQTTTRTPDAGAAAAPSPFADCAALTGAPAPARPPAEPLPELTLPCFTGGQPVRLRDVRGPAVLNVWQSTCAPCREELPAFQRLADRAAGRLKVVGVVSRDSREGARSFGTDLRISFPNVEDSQRRVQAAFGRTALPLTVFVDAGGSVRHVYNGPALDDARLNELVRTRLGVR
jgi:thiol-disulfide isomerase/thioredoxin